MCGTRSEELEQEKILCVVFDPDLGLCVELGDKKIDKEVYGYAPTQDFIRALAKEIEFQIGNTGDVGGDSTLGRVQKRFRKSLALEGES
jgi:hypothetical protein